MRGGCYWLPRFLKKEKMRDLLEQVSGCIDYSKLEQKGWTCDYGLDVQPFNLRPQILTT